MDGRFEPALDAATIYLRGFKTGNEAACGVLLKVSAAGLLMSRCSLLAYGHENSVRVDAEILTVVEINRLNVGQGAGYAPLWGGCVDKMRNRYNDYEHLCTEGGAVDWATVREGVLPDYQVRAVPLLSFGTR